MFRVPESADSPTFDQTFKVGFLRWLTSKKADRVEWMRRRNTAAKVAEQNQIARSETAGQAAKDQWDRAKEIMAEQKTAKQDRRNT